jgi:hypothetical protein
MLWSLSADAWFEIKKDEKLKEEKYFFLAEMRSSSLLFYYKGKRKIAEFKAISFNTH